MDFETEYKNELNDDSAIPEPLPFTDKQFPSIPQRQVLKEFYNEEGKLTGEIRIELGSDGAWLQFDCECLDALPYCQAQCCALIGTSVSPQELEKFDYPVDYNFDSIQFTMQRDADGFCTCLNKYSRTCEIYDHRPETCKKFHCTRGADVRGFKLANHVDRQSLY